MNLLQKASRFFHTVRYLRWTQVIYRLKYKCFPYRSPGKAINAPVVNSWEWAGPEIYEQSLFECGSVLFLNTRASFEDGLTWNDARFEKLWLYNLHYFDDLNALNNISRRNIHYDFILRWINENSAPHGNAWEPYPLSLRLVNWIKWYNRSGFRNKQIEVSILEQADALSKQLEYHILGNHLFANAKALVFIGCFIDGDLGAKYLDLGLEILSRQIPEQFLTDGGHFELSPMYHCILLWDLLDLINLAEITGRHELVSKLPQWRSVALKALSWLRVMQHPDGEVSFFNDSAMGIAATPAQLFSYAASLKLEVDNLPLAELVTLPVSGYSRVSMAEHSLLFDHAAVGPDYLPGHAHADTLSIEWSVGYERVLVNSGTSIYGISEERLRQRKTAAHNTVVIDNTDSSEVWSGFRVARRAYATLIQTQATDDNVMLLASHDGYKRLAGNVSHLREVKASDKKITVLDKLQGKFTCANVHWHLHPLVKVEQISENELGLLLNSGKRLKVECDVPLRVQSSTWHPGFCETINSNKIVADFSADSVKITFSII